MSQNTIRPLPLRTQGSAQIDLNGLNASDRERIAKVGFTQWLDEVCNAQEANARRGN